MAKQFSLYFRAQAGDSEAVALSQGYAEKLKAGQSIPDQRSALQTKDPEVLRLLTERLEQRAAAGQALGGDLYDLALWPDRAGPEKLLKLALSDAPLEDATRARIIESLAYSGPGSDVAWGALQDDPNLVGGAVLVKYLRTGPHREELEALLASPRAPESLKAEAAKWIGSGAHQTLANLPEGVHDWLAQHGYGDQKATDVSWNILA